VLAPLPYASSVLLMMVVAATGLIATDIWLGIAASSVFPLLILLNVMYQRRVDRWFDLAQDELGSLSAAVHESFEGVTVVKAFGAELQETNRLATIASRVKVARIEAIKLRSLFEAGLDFVPNLTNICLVVGGSFRVRSGDLSVGELASCIYMFTLLVFPLRLIGYAFSEMPRSQSGFARLRSLLDQEILADPRRKINQSAGGLTLTDVSVGHTLDKDVLTGMSASFKIGSITAIVGYTGSGKTTLLHAMAGLIEISSGVISGAPDGTALVFQEPFVVGSSVLDNITMGHEYRDEDVTRAIEIAEAQFLFDLPRGLQTIVGERGVGLSGGQRQRLALARAVITSPRVLLLDDTTSALDPLTESKVMGNLRKELGETTVVAVSSRPSIIALSDEVIFVADGGIVDQRPHQELLLCSAPYRQLMQAYEQDREES
jgi:ATP-binding cassette, subfamily B, bacterial